MCREMAAHMPVYAGPGTGPSAPLPGVVYCPSARLAAQTILAQADVLVTGTGEDLANYATGFNGPIVQVSHASGDLAGEYFRLNESRATHFVAVSEPAVLSFSPAVRKKTAIIHNGIDVHRCTPTQPRATLRAQWGFKDHHLLIGYVGRYDWLKNPTAAALAAKELGSDAYAIYTAQDQGFEQLRHQTHRLIGERARFVPLSPQVGDILTALDVFILASLTEAFSLSLAEAWYCGVPVVATRVGAIPELERQHGQLVAPVPLHPSGSDLAQAVTEALSPAFHREVVLRAQNVVSQFYTSAEMANRWTDYL